MKAYKGFRRNEDGTLSCRDFVYEPGKTYKHEGEIKLCKSGFHACHELWQTWLFYPNNGKNVFYEVECGGDIIEVDNSFGKLVCSEIKLVKEIDVTNVARFCVASYFYEGFAKPLEKPLASSNHWSDKNFPSVLMKLSFPPNVTLAKPS